MASICSLCMALFAFSFVPDLSAASLTLTWDSPTTNADGTPIANLTGYKIYYGTQSLVYTTSIDVGNVTTAAIAGLQEGTIYYFAGTAYNSSSNESFYTDELAWTAPLPAVSDHFSWSSISSPQTSGVSFPVTIQAVDTNNSLVTGFTGAVTLSGVCAERSLTVGAGTSAADYPLHATNDDARTQVIYLKNELGRASTIRSIALNVSTIPGQTLNNWTIRMKHTALSSFTSQSSWDTSGWTTVSRQNQAMSSTGWMEFILSTPFYYNGTNNLMVDFSFNNSSRTRSGHCAYTTASKSRRLYAAVNSTSGDPLAWTKGAPKATASTAVPNIRLRLSDPVAFTPAGSVFFTNGQWIGTITIPATVTGVVLSAVDGGGHGGNSRVFDVFAVSSSPAMLQSGSLSPPSGSSNESSAAITSLFSMPPNNIALEGAGDGMPPVVSLTKGANGFRMGIRGTLGADIQVQISSNPANVLAWEPLETVALNNAAPPSEGSGGQEVESTLDIAFVPAFEWFIPPVDESLPGRFFRAVMPYNYAVLADKVLKEKGYQTRLIVARLPGESLHDVCYVGQDGAYIDCSEEHYILALNSSGETIREIADDYSDYVKMNWTSASEFIFTNGVRQLISTVVKTDPPTSDPPLTNSQTSSIVVDF